MHHSVLLAERGTVLRRLGERGPGRGLKHGGFAVRQLDHCLERPATEEFAEHIRTDRVTVPRWRT